MKPFLLLTCLCSLALSSFGADVELAWEPEYNAALEQAAKADKPILVVFSATWCGPCKTMKKTTFANADVVADLKDWVCVKVNFDLNPQLISHYGIRGVPSSIILNPAGKEVSRRVGLLAPEPFREWISENLSDAGTIIDKAVRIQIELNETKLLFINAEGGAQRKVLIDIIKSASNPDHVLAGAALKTLKEIATEKQALILPYLNDSQLLVRVCVQHTLSQVLTEQIEFDPWADAETRAKAYALTLANVDRK